MVTLRTRVNAIHPKTDRPAVGMVIGVDGYTLTVQFADGAIDDYHISDITIFQD